MFISIYTHSVHVFYILLSQAPEGLIRKLNLSFTTKLFMLCLSLVLGNIFGIGCFGQLWLLLLSVKQSVSTHLRYTIMPDTFTYIKIIKFRFFNHFHVHMCITLSTQAYRFYQNLKKLSGAQRIFQRGTAIGRHLCNKSNH